MTTPLPLTRLKVACPIVPCPAGWTVDTVVPFTDPGQLQAQADRCVADHIAQAHPQTIPVVTVQTAAP